MAKAPARYHRVHYRRIDANEGDTSFEQLCRDALATLDGAGLPLWMRPNDRIMATAEEDVRRQILMNRVADLKTAVFGEVCLAHENDLQAMLTRAPKQVKLSDITTATIFDLSESEAPKGSQFIRGLGYWLAIGNHLFFMQLHALTAKQMQEYLTWLIRSEAERRSLSRPTSSFLVEIDVSQIGETGIGDIKNLHIKGNSQFGVRVPVDQRKATTEKQYSRKVRSDHKVSDQALPLAVAIIGEARTKSLVDSLGPEEYLTATGELRVAGKRTETSRETIRSIAHEIADETDAEVTVEGKFGKITNGDAILRTKMPFEAPNDGGTLLDFDNVADQLQVVYSRFVQDGKIKA